MIILGWPWFIGISCALCLEAFGGVPVPSASLLVVQPPAAASDLSAKEGA